MSEIGDILGEDFEEEYEETTDQRRQQRRRVDTDTLKAIAYEAIYGGGWKGESPRFVFEGEEIDHDVVLLETPEEDMDKFIHQFPDGGGLSVGMFHQGVLWSAAFNDELMEAVDKLEEDKPYLVVGRYTENTTTDDDGNEQIYYNISPVRGIVPLSVAKDLANDYQEGQEASTVEEQAQEQAQDEDLDLGVEDEEEAGYDDILRVIKGVASQREEVIRAVAGGDMDALEKLIEVVDNNTEGTVTEESVVEVFESEVQEIEGYHEEEEEEDDLDLGGLDIGGTGEESEGEDEDLTGEEEEEETTSTSSTEEDEEEGGEIDEWF